MDLLGGVVDITSGMSCQWDDFFFSLKNSHSTPQTQMHRRAFDGEGWFASEDPAK